MKMFNGLFEPGRAPNRQPKIRDVEARFLKLYSKWHETHDLTLRKRLLIRLSLIMRRTPSFDLRSKFNHAF